MRACRFGKLAFFSSLYQRNKTPLSCGETAEWYSCSRRMASVEFSIHSEEIIFDFNRLHYAE